MMMFTAVHCVTATDESATLQTFTSLSLEYTFILDDLMTYNTVKISCLTYGVN